MREGRGEVVFNIIRFCDILAVYLYVCLLYTSDAADE